MEFSLFLQGMKKMRDDTQTHMPEPQTKTDPFLQTDPGGGGGGTGHNSIVEFWGLPP